MFQRGLWPSPESHYDRAVAKVNLTTIPWNSPRTPGKTWQIYQPDTYWNILCFNFLERNILFSGPIYPKWDQYESWNSDVMYKAVFTSVCECRMRHAKLREMLMWKCSRGVANSICSCGKCSVNSQTLSVWSQYFKDKHVCNAGRMFN